MKKSVSFLAVVLLVGSSFSAPRKKVIAYGWDILAASPSDILAHAADFDRLPIDGVIISSNGKNAEGRNIQHRYLMNNPAWNYDALDGEIDTLREIVKHPSLRESFLGAWISTEPRLKWTDEVAWKRASANISVLAHLAKAGGLKGLALDAEDYHKTAQFYRAKDDPPYEELKGIVRRRGREFFKAIFDEYPDVTLFSFWIMSFEPAYRKSADLQVTASRLGDLWPSFIDGMFDVMPKTARFVDGDEHSYKYQAGRGEFVASAYHRLSRVLPLLAPEHRETYRGRVSISNALYPDAFADSSKPGMYWYQPPLDGSRDRHFRLCIAEAFNASDEYVWLYGEQGTWIDWEGPFYRKHYASNIAEPFRRDWNVAFPGLYLYLAALRTPQAVLAKVLSRGLKASDNLIRNPLCRSVGANRLPSPYGFRCDAKELTGDYGVDETVCRGEAKSLYLKGTARTYLLATEPVTSGSFYVASVLAKGTGSPTACVWMMTGSEHRHDLPTPSLEFGAPDEDGWRQGSALVLVPQGVTHVEMNLGGDLSGNKQIFFCEPYLGRLAGKGERQ